MIEKIVRDFLNGRLDYPVYMEVPKGVTLPAEFVVVEKTGSGMVNHLKSATFAIQSYAASMYRAASVNEEVKEAMDSLITLDAVSRSALNSDYNFTDTQKKQYRYQAVYDINHY